MSPSAPSRRTFCAWLAAWPALARARARPEALPLLLAHDAPPDLDPAGYLVSEKLDGVRAFWDGRSLRFRSGLGVAAPDWFVARLPPVPLDGELWLARGCFEELAGIVRRRAPKSADWRPVRYHAFELPHGGGTFADRAAQLRRIASGAQGSPLAAVEQSWVASRAELRRKLDAVLRAGGEGLMLHRADAAYESGRSRALLKLKPTLDAEARVVGHVAGRGRHASRLGALRVRTEQGVEFLLGSGFTDAQRRNPPAPGALVTFSYRGLTGSGVPRFASFLRVRDV